jgi:OHCU decarboxylase
VTHAVRFLNAVPDDQAEAALLACCGSRAWVRRMLALRPFRDAYDLFAAADRIWRELGRDDWLEAFGAHPRIGERAGKPTSEPSTGELAREWSAGEQAGALAAPHAVRAALEEANRAYEERFGHIFIVCATGKSADEMLELLRARLPNDSSAELSIAAEEQRKITRLRLEKLVST